MQIWSLLSSQPLADVSLPSCKGSTTQLFLWLTCLFSSLFLELLEYLSRKSQSKDLRQSNRSEELYLRFCMLSRSWHHLVERRKSCRNSENAQKSQNKLGRVIRDDSRSWLQLWNAPFFRFILFLFMLDRYLFKGRYLILTMRINHMMLKMCWLYWLLLSRAFWVSSLLYLTFRQFNLPRLWERLSLMSSIEFQRLKIFRIQSSHSP